MTLEDLAGSLEAMVFSTQYERLLAGLSRTKPFWCEAWSSRKRTRRRRFRFRTSFRWKWRACDLPSLISIRVSVGTDGNGKAER